MLRKGCCHPLVFDKSLANSKNSKSSSNIRDLSQGPRPFGEIMIIKVEQIRNSCEEKLRELLYHLFTMAGIDLLSHERRKVNIKPIREHLINVDGFILPSNGTIADILRSPIRALTTYLKAESYLSRTAITPSPLITLIRCNPTCTQETSPNSKYIGQESCTSVNLTIGWQYQSSIFGSSEDIAANISRSNCHATWCSDVTGLEEECNRITKRRKMRIIIDNIAIPGIDVIPLTPQMSSVVLQMHSSHKITSILSLRFNFNDLTNKLFSQLEYGNVIAITFPKDIFLFSGTRWMNTFTLSKRYTTSLDDIKLVESNDSCYLDIPMTVCSEDGSSRDYRAKSWKLEYSSICDDFYMIARKYCGNGSMDETMTSTIEYCFPPCDEDTGEMISLLSLSSWWEKYQKTDRKNEIIYCLQTQVIFGESAYDVDAFQQLHLGSNILFTSDLIMSMISSNKSDAMSDDSSQDWTSKAMRDIFNQLTGDTNASNHSISRRISVKSIHDDVDHLLNKEEIFRISMRDQSETAYYLETIKNRIDWIESQVRDKYHLNSSISGMKLCYLHCPF